MLFLIFIGCYCTSYSQAGNNHKIPFTYKTQTTYPSKRFFCEIKSKLNNDEKEQNTEPINNNIDYIKSKWIELLGLLIAFFAFIIPTYRYISQKREEQKDKRFRTYHQLIADLINPPNGKLDRQIATVFELRNYPNYFELTERIITDLKEQWKSDSRNDRLIKELKLTLDYIEKKSKWYNKLLHKIFGIK